MLAAGCTGGRIGEIGTGTGFATAWMVTAMPHDAQLVTVEAEEQRANAAAEIFAADSRVTVIHGDANQAIPAHAPYDLLFSDGGWREPGRLPDLLRPGGRLVVDDVTPQAALPEDSPFRVHDPKRDLFVHDRRLVSAEIVLPTYVTPSWSAPGLVDDRSHCAFSGAHRTVTAQSPSRRQLPEDAASASGNGPVPWQG